MLTKEEEIFIAIRRILEEAFDDQPSGGIEFGTTLEFLECHLGCELIDAVMIIDDDLTGGSLCLYNAWIDGEFETVKDIVDWIEDFYQNLENVGVIL